MAWLCPAFNRHLVSPHLTTASSCHVLSCSVWKAHPDQVAGWEDDPRSGRPPKLTEKEQNRAVKLTLKEPRSLRQVLTAIASTVGKILQAAEIRLERL